jgi:hypothetical protein
MAQQNIKIVIAACLVIGAIVGVPWAESGASRIDLDAPPASKSCGDFQIPGPVRYPPIKVEVVHGNVPCRAAQRVMKAQYREETPHAREIGFWSCGGQQLGIIECEKNGRRGQETIRARLYCRYWGALQSSCLDAFGTP